MSPLQERIKKQRKNRGKRTLAIVLIILFFTAVVGASFYWFNSKLFGDTKKRNVEAGMMVAQDKMTIMVMGIDQRADDVGRSDTLMVATVDPQKKKAAVLSIPRDTRVKISGHGYDKINHAYAYGGHDLSKETVENLLGVPMDHYVLIDTKAFERIIDALGGVDIDVEKRMYYEDPWDDNGGLVIDLYPGQQHMNGETAIQYVRYRDEEGDIGRIERQQKFMKAVVNKIATPGIVTKLPAIVKEVSSAVKTDMSVSQMISLLGVLKDAKENGINSEMLPGKPAYISEISYWLPDVKKLRSTLASILDVKMDDRMERAMQREAHEYENSIPKEMKIVDTPKEAVAKTEKKSDQRSGKDQIKDKTKSEDTKKKSSEEEKKSEARVPSTISVEVVNASGIDGAGAEVAGILRRQGFSVTGVSTLTAPYKKTTVITNTSNESVTGKFAALPFNYTIQINDSSGDAGQATVVIGKDYGK